MTSREKYCLLLEELSELLKSKNDIISLQRYELEGLRSKIAELNGNE